MIVKIAAYSHVRSAQSLPVSTTYDEVRRLLLALPGGEEGQAYGGPSLHVGRKFLGRLLEDGETLVLKIDPVERDRLLERAPDAFFLTHHYRSHPYILINLPSVDRVLLRRLVERAWRMVASKRAITLYEKTNRD